MDAESERDPSELSVGQDRKVDALASEFARELQAGAMPRIEEYLARCPADVRRRLLVELVVEEVEYRRRGGAHPDMAEYVPRFPAEHAAVREAFAALPKPTRAKAKLDEETIHWLSGPTAAIGAATPERIGRYALKQILGQGAFGIVYLAHDPKLGRDVAIKVPRRERFRGSADAARYLHEARMAARLNHPNIVAVYDVLDEDGQLAVVQERVDGEDLRSWIDRRTSPLGFDWAANLVAEIADTMAYAHREGVIHRDLKPQNVLIGSDGRPRVTDFGLALDERARRRAVGELAGSPAYMSPEQVCGESNRLDGRSDIWALGVILYELLTGRKPFYAESSEELFADIAQVEPQPPRQIDPRIPVELERICLRCLEKRMSYRYTTATDLALDLRTWREASKQPVGSSQADAVAGASTMVTPPARIVPKGLRSFDEQDADFFVELLPGPRGRDGLPESIRFWKLRIESADTEVAFPVGLMYGPSGCGKSSLAKAGLMPRLADHVLAVYVEATPSDTEARLIRGLGKIVTGLPANVSLAELLADLRDRHGLPGGKKIVLVLDQFEQWLHVHAGDRQAPLTAALRQCDGVHVQAVLMVRDDFWMPATRLFQDLDLPLVEGHNQGIVDLFDPLHARKVLAEFGRAYGRLPDKLSDFSPNENVFLDQAIGGLTQRNKVYCVQLALFADLMKGRPWSPNELSAVGGTAGIGVTFLEETFAAPSAPAPHRHHAAAIRGVLQALLPAAGADLKGYMRSAGELQAAAGYLDRPREFGEVLRILDRDVRLLTPAQCGEAESVHASRSKLEPEPASRPADLSYQLTHDYLVPALREWLTRKQRETRRGRAELCLADRTAAWLPTRENRQLPDLPEYLDICRFISRRERTEPQRQLMRAAFRYHASRSGSAVLVALLLTLVLAIGGPLWAWREAGLRKVADRETQRAAANATAADNRSKEADAARRVAAANARVADDRRQEADAARRTAEDLALDARARSLSLESAGVLEDSAPRSLLLAVEAVEMLRRANRGVDAAVEAGLRDVLSQCSGSRFGQHQRNIENLVMSPDDKFLISAGDSELQLQAIEAETPDWLSQELNGRGLDVAVKRNRVYLASNQVVQEFPFAGAARWSTTETRSIDGGDFSATTLAVSPNERWLVAAGWYGDVVLWDLTADNRRLHARKKTESGDPIWRVVLTDRWCLTQSNKGVTRFELTPAGLSAPVRMDTGNAGGFPAVTPDGKWMFVSSAANVQAWNLETGDLATAPILLRGHVGPVTALATSRDSRWLASAGEDLVIRLWDLARMEERIPKVLHGHTERILTLRFSSQGLLASGSRDKTIRLWRAADADPARTCRLLRGHEQQVSELEFSRDGRHLFSASSDEVIRRWSTDPSTDVAEIHPVRPFQAFIGTHPRISIDGRWLVEGCVPGGNQRFLDTGDSPSSALLRRIDGPAVPLRGHKNSISHVQYSQDHQWMFTASDHFQQVTEEDGRVLVWDLSNGPPAEPRFLLEGFEHAVMGLWVNASADSVIAASRHGELCVWRRQDGQWRRDVRQAIPGIFTRRTSFVDSMAISPDHRWLATPRNDPRQPVVQPGWEKSAPEVLLCDLRAPKGVAIQTMMAHSSPIATLKFSPDSRWLATSDERTVCVWDMQGDRGRPAAQFASPAEYSRVEFSPDSRWLSVHGGKFTDLLRLSEDLPAEPVRFTLPLPVMRTAFSPDTGALVVVCNDGDNLAFMTTALFSTRLDQPELRLIGWPSLPSLITTMAFSSDGRLLATGFRDRLISVWDLKSGGIERAAVPLKGHAGKVTDLRFVDDDQRLLSVSDDGTLRLWELRLDKLLSAARRMAGRELTVAERRQYGLPETPGGR